MANRRTLILMRHAQTEETRPGSHDTDRRLTAHGEHQARDAGEFLRDQGIVIDTVLCSSAVRTRQTLELLDLDGEVAIDISVQYYNAGTDTLIEAIMALSDDCRTALMIGHAPAVPGLVYELCDEATSHLAAFSAVAARFPAGTIARLEFDGDWTEVGTSRLVSARYPDGPNS
jgi:phosphohistidine phosphatase